MQPEQAQAADIELLHAVARGDETALGTAAVFAITLEPENGVQFPTGQIYLSSPS